MQEARSKYVDACKQLFGSAAGQRISVVTKRGITPLSQGPVAVSDSDEDEFDKGTFADVSKDRSFVSPQAQVSRPDISSSGALCTGFLDPLFADASGSDTPEEAGRAREGGPEAGPEAREARKAGVGRHCGSEGQSEGPGRQLGQELCRADTAGYGSEVVEVRHHEGSLA